MAETAYPLTWPTGQQRTKPSDRIWNAPFSVGEAYDKTLKTWNGSAYVEHTVRRTKSKEVGVPLATERLEQQLSKLGADHPILSTNLELRLNGMPRGGQKDPNDPGAAVWFTFQGKRTVLACDKWMRVADNIAALAAHIRAIRSVENYGVGTLEQAFRGYQALPAPNSEKPWRQVLPDCQTLEQAETKYKQRAMSCHPDRGGNPIQMAELTRAIAEARKELRAGAVA